MADDPYDYIAEAITAHWGERCPDYEPQCACCAAWAQYDALKANGMNRAIKFVTDRRDDYLAEHGRYDYETGLTECSPAGEEYVSELEEIMERLEALRAPNDPA